MLVNNRTENSSESLPSDMDEYKGHVLAGSIYDELASIWSTSRDEAKTKFLAYCNTPPRKLVQIEHWSMFHHYFPSVASAIEKINLNFLYTKDDVFRMARGKRKKFRANGAKYRQTQCAYALLTQALEAFLLLDTVIPRIAEKDPSIPLVSIHDAIYSQVQHQDIVVSEIRAVYQEMLGVDVAFKQKIIVGGAKV